METFISTAKWRHLPHSPHFSVKLRQKPTYRLMSLRICMHERCQALTAACWGNECEMVQCLNAKGLQFCYECLDFESHTCGKLEKFSKDYLKDDGVGLRANLARIKAGDIDNWLRESEEKFRCPQCGKPLPTSSFRKKCLHCSKNFHVELCARVYV